MLLELTVANFAIIERLQLRFAPGFNVLTGETGAGKSILIDAVDVLLGGRGNANLVRTGAEQARVEGVFELPQDFSSDDTASLAALLRENGIPLDEDAIILSRELNANGRTIARVNGRAVPVVLLQQVGRMLVDVHGQGEHQSLLRVSRHLDLLDRFGGLLNRRRAFSQQVSELRQVRKEIAALLSDERELARRVDLLTFQVAEIRGAQLRVDEEEEIEAERRVLEHAEQLATGADLVYAMLRGRSGEERGALDALSEARAQISALADLDPSLVVHQRVLDEALYQLEDVGVALRRYRDGVEPNPERLEEIEERLSLIHGQKRKYGSSIREILAFEEQAARELDGIVNVGERLGELREREGRLLASLGRDAEAFSEARAATALTLADAVERELADLNMAGTVFTVSLDRDEAEDGLALSDGRRYAFHASGVDRGEFLIAPNPGEALMPLARTASGGEMSRLMLALKTILARADEVPTLIFDEIDVGLGGRIGQIVGLKLSRLAATEHQVLCITHLPQIACFGDAHYLIQKGVANGRTTTSARHLSDEERVDELTMMLSGAGESPMARENARELLALSDRVKQTAKANV